MSFISQFEAFTEFVSWLILAQLDVIIPSPSVSPSPALPAPGTLAFWQDPVWGSIGGIAGLVALLLAWKALQRKSLSYEVLLQENIVKNAYDSIEDGLQISYKGKLVPNLFLVNIKLINSGNTEIRPDDYTEPVTIILGQKSEVLGGKILEEIPANLRIESKLKYEKNFVKLNPVLLNKADYFIVQLFIMNLEKVEVEGRIAGVKQIKRISEVRQDIFLGIGAVLAAALIVVSYYVSPWLSRFLLVSLFGLLCVRYISLLIFEWYRSYEIKRQRRP